MPVGDKSAGLRAGHAGRRLDDSGVADDCDGLELRIPLQHSLDASANSRNACHGVGDGVRDGWRDSEMFSIIEPEWRAPTDDA